MSNLMDIKHKKTALILAGALAALGFAPVYALPLFVAGLIFAFLMADGAKTLKQSALFGYMFGFGFFCAGFYWIANALLVDVFVFGWLYPIALVATGAFFGLFFIPPFMIWYHLKGAVWGKVLGFASAFVLLEYVRSFLLTGFPWNMAGSMFAFSDMLIQTASAVGTYGLSFLLLVMTGAVYIFIKEHDKKAVFAFFGILFLMAGFGVFRLSVYKQSDSEVKIRLVQPSIKQSLKWDESALEDNLRTYIDMSRKTNLNGVKAVFWGETATAFSPEDGVYYQNLIRQAVPQNGYLMTGVVRYDKNNDALYNSLSVIDDAGKTVAFYDKNHLVPFGEYIPLRKYLPAWIRPVANQIADLQKGEKFKVLKVSGLPPFGALICYEIIFPDDVINRKNKPQFIVVASNDGWYGQSFGPYQHFVAAQLRAIEEGITIIRSANNGISAVIDPLGRVGEKLNLNEVGFKDVFLPAVLSVNTLYAHLGSKGVQCLMLLLLVFAVIQNKHNINK